MRSSRFAGFATFSALALLGLGLSQAGAAGQPVHSPPYDVEVFVRGTFNGWGLGHEMKFDAVENEYVAYVELTPGGHEFKIASADWATVDLGYADDGVVELGVPEPIAHVDYGNLYLEVADAAVYSFEFNVSDPDNLTVLVEYARKGGDGAQVYIQSWPASWGFDCLGAANPVVGTITIKGVAYDQNGIEYRLNMARPLVFNGKADTSFTYSENFRAKWISQGGTPDLYMTYHYKVTVSPTGEAKREIIFYADGCR
jgi:catechol 2,3-dioxygenase-like lactoylglutathione lyase family enzyme